MIQVVEDLEKSTRVQVKEVLTYRDHVRGRVANGWITLRNVQSDQRLARFYA